MQRDVRVWSACRRALMGAAMLTTACQSRCFGTPSGSDGPANIDVTFPGSPAAMRPLVVFSGRRAGDCRVFELYSRADAQPIPVNDVAWDPACVTEVDAFAPASGAFVRVVDPAVPSDVSWFRNVLATGKMPLTMPPMLRLPVRVWLIAPPSQMAAARSARDRMMESAFPILEELGTGFSLDTSSVERAPGAEIPPDCAKASVIVGNGAVHAPERINVYFVENYLDAPYSSYAINCWMQGYPGIAFVSWGNPATPSTALVHEIGHALGLIHPKLPTSSLEIGGGHTDNVTAFPAFNLMESGAATITNLSVGQRYAMNFGQSSWINRAGSPFVRPLVRACQDAWGNGACLALTAFQPGWPTP